MRVQLQMGPRGFRTSNDFKHQISVFVFRMHHDWQGIDSPLIDYKLPLSDVHGPTILYSLCGRPVQRGSKAIE